MRLLVHAAVLIIGLAAAPGAFAQAFLPGSFSALPSFAWPGTDPLTAPAHWEGSYARMSTGFQVSSSKRLGTVAGPTIGFEGGQMLREGDLVYGIVGGFDAMAPFGGYGTPRFGAMTATRDFAGVMQFKAGAIVADNVLVYAKVGAAAVNQTLRFGASSLTTPFSRSDIVVRPDARVGVEWAVTDRLSVGVEVGMSGQAIR